MTWTDATVQTETWTEETPSLHVFSPLVFSHGFVGSLRAFALGSADGNTEVWDAASVNTESWTPA